MKNKKEVIEMYSTQNIKKWFKNYKTFCYMKDDIAQIKHEYLIGEYKEIKYYTKNKKLQKELFKKVQNITLKGE